MTTELIIDHLRKLAALDEMRPSIRIKDRYTLDLMDARR